MVPYKEHVVWDHQTHRLGYSSPYIHTPCLRIFDQQFKFYIDVYSFEEVSAERAQKLDAKGRILLPPDYHFDQPLVCNQEGLDPSGAIRDSYLTAHDS